ncbi:MAG: hypothetical protein QG655_2471 [Actinomycetota bacterium]|nr:hypothetical protein [Actinomycetota bacterium]
MGVAATAVAGNSAGRRGGVSQTGRLRSPALVGLAGVGATGERPGAAWATLENYAALISDRTPVRTLRVPLPAGDVRAVSDRIISMSYSASVVFVVGLDPLDSAAVQHRAADYGGPLVITEIDVVSVALAAAVLAMLRDRRPAARRGGIVVIDIERAPRLGPLLFALSGRSVTSWHERDAAAGSLCAALGPDDVLVDLAGSAPSDIAAGRTVTMPTVPFDYGALALPGLLSALGRCSKPVLTLELLASCARALALLTPAGAVLPDLRQRLLVPAVARHVARSLGERVQPGSADGC